MITTQKKSNSIDDHGLLDGYDCNTDQTDACGRRTKKSVANSKRLNNYSNIVNSKQ